MTTPTVDWGIFHLLNVGGTTHRTPALLISEVPETLWFEEVQQALRVAGRAPIEGGVMWANHELECLRDMPPLIWPQAISWEELEGGDERARQKRMTVRMPAHLHRDLTALSDRKRLSLNTLVVKALNDYVREDESVTV